MYVVLDSGLDVTAWKTQAEKHCRMFQSRGYGCHGLWSDRCAGQDFCTAREGAEYAARGGYATVGEWPEERPLKDKMLATDEKG